MAGPLVLPIPTQITSLVQDRTLERVYHDAMFPKLLFRAEATPELWPVNVGDNQTFTRSGLLAPATTPLTAGVDPTPKTSSIEQWEATAQQYGDTVDTHMPTSYVALASLFLRNAQQLGLQAGQTLNRLVRNALYKPYVGGHTVLTAAAGAGDTAIQVAALNGFRFNLVNGRPQVVSSVNPLPITIFGVATVLSVIGTTPADAADPDGPGTLTLNVAVGGAGAAARAAVLSGIRATLIRAGGGDSVDALSAADIVTLQDFISAVARLREQSVPPFADGFYHAHLDPITESQIFADAAFRQLNTALPDYLHYRELAMGHLVGIMFYRNTECPRRDNSGALIATGASSLYAKDIAAEVVNATGVGVRRAVVLGQGSVYEKYLDESKFISEGGVQGKIGSFDVVNNSLQVSTERIRYIVRAPQDRLQQMVSQSWSWSGDFPVPSDITAGDASRFKRAVIIEHAG